MEEVFDDAGPLAVTVDAVEDVTCRLHRQCRDLRTLAVWGNRCNAGSDADAYRFDLAQFVHQGIDFLGVCSFGVEDGFCVIKDDHHLLGGKEWSQWCQVLGVFNPCADNLGEPGKEMGTRSWELIASDESTVLAKSFFDPVVVKNCESDGRFADPSCADESNGFQVFGESDDPFNQIITSKTGPWR